MTTRLFPSMVLACLMGACALGAGSAGAQSRWQEANALVAAIGGWRTYLQERAEPPAGYPMPPEPSAALLPDAVLSAPPSLASELDRTGWEGRRLGARSLPLQAPTVTLARITGKEESSQEVGIHLPVGSWLHRTRSLAADDAQWGEAEQQALALKSGRDRLLTYAAAVTAKAELAQAMDRLEVLRILEELVRRQRQIGAVPESDLLSLSIERAEGEVAEFTTREEAWRAAERLALELGQPASQADALLARLPLELSQVERLPQLPGSTRLDIRVAEEALAQERTALSGVQRAAWLSSLEVGLLQERTDTGEVSNTVEFSWRLPFGGPEARQADLSATRIRQMELEVRRVRLEAERETREADRIKRSMAQRFVLTGQALAQAETWMEEQVYRYSGMLISPHDLLRAASRLRNVRSRHIAARHATFTAAVHAHYAQVIPGQLTIQAGASPASSAPDAGH